MKTAPSENHCKHNFPKTNTLKSNLRGKQKKNESTFLLTLSGKENLKQKHHNNVMISFSPQSKRHARENYKNADMPPT